MKDVESSSFSTSSKQIFFVKSKRKKLTCTLTKLVGYELHYFVNVKNSSFVKPASEIISISNPRFISLCFGTGSAMSSFTRIMWLPFWRATRKPALMRALTTSRHESRGSFDNYFSLFTLDFPTQKFSFNF